MRHFGRNTTSAYLTPHLLVLATDPWVLAAAAVLVLQAVVVRGFDSGLPPWLLLRLPLVVLGALALGALWWKLDLLRQREERLFWKDLATASSALLGVYVLRLPDGPPFLAVAADLFYIAFFVVFVLALERRPHRHHPWRPGSLDRSLSWPALLVFVCGLLSYLVIQPIYFDAYRPQVASTWLALVLDVFLAIRLILAATKSSSIRWQNIYTVLAMALMLAVGRDCWQMVDIETPQELASLKHVVLAGVPLLLLLLAARIRLRRFPADALIEEERADAGISSPAGQGMVFALAFPLLHFSSRLAVEDAVPDEPRELLLLGVSLALGGLAYLQYQRLRDGMTRLRSERSLFEEELLESEQDLRLMVEQKQTAETLSTFERNFIEIFHRNPDALAICSLDDGEFLEVNNAFATLFGYQPAEMVGQTPHDLGMVESGEAFEPLRMQLQRQDSLRLNDLVCRHRQGEWLTLEISTRRVEIDNQPSVLIVTSLSTTDAVAEDAGTPVEDRLAAAKDAVWVVDGEGAITYWNRAAEAIFGWPAERVLGQPIDQVLDLQEPAQTHDPVDPTAQWFGDLEPIHADGQRLRLQCRYLWLNAVDDAGADDAPNGRSRLAIGRVVEGGAAET